MKHYNLVVAGGGLAGVGAAVSAAREGISVLLIEKSGCLGGAISNNLVYPFTNYYTFSPETNEKQYINLGIFKEMREREEAYRTALNEPKDSPEYLFKPEYYKLVLDDMIADSGADVLFHAKIFDVKTDGRQIKQMSVATPSGVINIDADFFIDATGDGELFAMAGCDFQLAENQTDFVSP